MSISNTSKTSFSIAKHVLYKNKGNFLTLSDKISLSESKKKISLNKEILTHYL
jgi:hypothetical protein